MEIRDKTRQDMKRRDVCYCHRPKSILKGVFLRMFSLIGCLDGMLVRDTISTAIFHSLFSDGKKDLVGL
jgi:hypothetical protein